MGIHFKFFPSLSSSHREKEKFKVFKKLIESPDHGFFFLNEKEELVQECQVLYQKFSKKKCFVQVGIGGSALGPQMLLSALKKENHTHFCFVDNIDPDDTYDKINALNLEESLFYIVSKSGGTAETMASFALITNTLKENGIDENRWSDFFVFCTDPHKSDLLELSRQYGISCLQVPSNIGGRYSVLSPVGLFPALFAGISVKELLAGAQEIKKEILLDNVDENHFLQMASFLFEHKKKGHNQTVLMPYSSKLKDFSAWFVQLWAESLGKEKDNDNKTVHEGFTPIAAFGATDQHSQVQLFMEGPYDKCLILIEVDQFKHDFCLENSFSVGSLQKLAPFTLGQLMKAEFNGTLKALEEKKRPYISLSLGKLNENALGALILLFESLTALMGIYLNINPFDQPGVDAGKRYAFEWLHSERD